MKLEEFKDISQELYEFLNKITTKGCEDGRYDFSEGIYVNVCSYETLKREEKVFEAHRKYIDVQIMLSGCEIVSVESLTDMYKGKCVSDYSEQSDAELYEMNIFGRDYVLNKGDILVLYSEDAHAPGICIEKPDMVKKAIVKIPINLIKK